jgi:hypothetical protein
MRASEAVGLSTPAPGEGASSSGRLSGMKRPPTPGPLRRLTFHEAGGRCACCGTKRSLTVSHLASWPETVERMTAEGWPAGWEWAYRTEFNQPANVIAQCRQCHDDYEAGRIPRNELQQRRCDLALSAARRGIYHDYLWNELAQSGEGRLNLDALANVVLWMHQSYADGALPEPHSFIIVSTHRPCSAFHVHVDLSQARMSMCAADTLPCRQVQVWSPAERRRIRPSVSAEDKKP